MYVRDAPESVKCQTQIHIITVLCYLHNIFSRLQFLSCFENYNLNANSIEYCMLKFIKTILLNRVDRPLQTGYYA